MGLYKKEGMYVSIFWNESWKCAIIAISGNGIIHKKDLPIVLSYISILK